jgi:hypothetical protein
VLGKDKSSLNYLGTLDKIWDTGLAVPAPGPPNAVAALNGSKTSDIKISAGLEILANALSGMFGATVPSLKLAYKNAKSVQFRFTDVQSVGIDPFVVGNFLASGDLKEGNPFVARFFGQDDTEAFVITEILQSKSISVTAKKDSATDVAVDVPAIQQLLGAKIAVGTTSGTDTEVTYTGPELLTFGFKVFGIGIANGVWQVHGVKPGQELAFADEQEVPEPIVMRRNGFLEIQMEAGQPAGV